MISTILTYLVLSVAITSIIVFTCKMLWTWLTKSEKQARIDFDFEQAIRKKQRLENN